jgi:hypothetical protein
MSFNYRQIEAQQIYYEGKPIIRMYKDGIMVYPTTAFRIDVDGLLLTQNLNFLQSTKPFWGFLMTQQNDYLTMDNINVIEFSDYWERYLQEDVVLLTQFNDNIILEYEQ